MSKFFAFFYGMLIIPFIIPHSVAPNVHATFLLSKSIHVVAFAIMGGITFVSFRPWVKYLIFTGILTEIIQLFVPTRGASIRDAIINVVSFALGFFILYLIGRYNSNKKQIT